MDKPGTSNNICSSSSMNAHNNIPVIELGSDDDDNDNNHYQNYEDALDPAILDLGLKRDYDAQFLPKKLEDSPECVEIKSTVDLNLVDASYELVDPTPNIHELFVRFDQQFFWSTLTSRACMVEWSKTMTSCAGICRFNVGNGLCCIRLSEPLLKLRPRKDLVETLLHEMIHGYLFIIGGIQDRDGHGPEFQMHMHRINGLAGTSITVYHSFHAEVAHYKVHWWRCTGPCKDRGPFYGWVKRAMNRAPSPNDWWWKEHQANCNGTFVKVKEPEKKEKEAKSKKTNSPSSRKRSKSSENVDPKQQKIDKFFPGKGHVLGSSLAPMKKASTEEDPFPMSSSAASDIVVGETVTKRKRRTKEEIEQEKLEKEMNKVRRQMQSAKHTKCEQYLFCHFSAKILDLDDDLNNELTKRFEERGIAEQLIVDKSHRNLMQVIWRKKRLEAFLEEGKLHKNEKMELQSTYCCVLNGETFSILAKTKGNCLMDYLEEQLATMRNEPIVGSQPRLRVIVLGKHNLRESNVCSLVFEAFEKHRIQFHFMASAQDFSFLIVQIHRSLAKMEKKVEKHAETEENGGMASTHFAMEKGMATGPKMVEDWWAKMLEHMHRMSEEQKRAIIRKYPNPIKLMDWLTDPENPAGDAMFALSEIEMESGRRLGPVLAQKIYKMLTSRDGTELFE